MAECFGISGLGLCSYDPRDPAAIYFSIGEAVAALSISLAIPQFLKPIYRFRLAARSIRTVHLYVSVFVGAACVVVAATLPHLPLERTSVFAYPVVWEICGGMLFIAAFAILALAVLRPPRLRNGSYSRFGRAAADFLAHATERDQIDFADDLYRNFARLLKTAGFARYRDELDAFFLFRFRRQIEDASYARALLTLVSEPQFCEVLVRLSPWTTAQIVHSVARSKLLVHEAAQFIQEVARQAIVSPSSMLAREIGYKGFVAAPVLSSSLFNERYIVRHYDPLSGLEHGDFRRLDDGVVARLAYAYKAALETLFEAGDIHSARSLRHLPNHLQSAAYQAHRQLRQDRNTFGVALEVCHCIRQLVEDTRKFLTTLDNETYESLYITAEEPRDFTLLDYLSEALTDVLFSFANDFSGHDDPYWTIAIELIDETFEWTDNQPDGMDPLQQRVAVKLIDKVRDNMNGWYPSITRVLLPVLGRVAANQENPRCARAILLRAFSAELKRFPDLYEKDTGKALDHIAPDSVRYDAANQAIIQVYRDGEGAPLNLRDIQRDAPSLQRADVRTKRG